ncbi:MAG TPA: hypothetical protein PKH77_26450 [Anaerolineae bacterium]|nr:hypothetical protein [Anaerolineae bacterium]
MNDIDGARVWQTALGELELQMTRATFDTWVQDTHWLQTDEEHELLLIGVKNGYAVE